MFILFMILLQGFPQPRIPSYTTANLPVCDARHNNWVVVDLTAVKLVKCDGVSSWSTFDVGGGGTTLPSGTIVMITSGSCATGYTEVTALSGKTIVGTVAANADVGTTGGSDSITPAGTVSQPTFTGNALAGHLHGVGTYVNGTVGFTPAGTNAWPAGVPTFSGTQLATHGHTFTGDVLATHAHELPFQIPTTTSIRQIASGTFGTGTSRAATATITTTANTTSAAVAKSQAVSAGTPTGTVVAATAGTPAGTIAWPATFPIFTGTAGTVPAETITGSSQSVTAGTPAGTVSQPTFTGTSFDNRPAFIKAIFCSKN